MPVITQPFGLDGPIVELLVGVSQARQLRLQAQGRVVPSQKSVRFLIDTGASQTCLDPSIIAELEIPQLGEALMHSASTGGKPQKCRTFDISLWLPVDYQGGHPISRTMNIMECELRSSGFEGLLGREVLSKCVLTYNGPKREAILAL